MHEVSFRFDSKNLSIFSLGTLFALLFFTIFAGLYAFAPEVLAVAFLDIGQGDSILITSPSGNNMIIDGGPDKSVLSALGRHMPFWERSIDVMLATHPDADHTAGLSYVLDRFHIGAFIDQGKDSGTLTYHTLEQKVADNNVPRFLAKRGMDIDFGDGADFLILYPDKDVSQVPDTNLASIVGKLSYGNTAFILTGDAPKSTEDHLVALDGSRLEANVLKVGHHGSKTSSDPVFVNTVHPQYAVISAGKNNMYGFPATQTIDTLQNEGAKILITFNLGDIVFTSDGNKVMEK